MGASRKGLKISAVGRTMYTMYNKPAHGAFVGFVTVRVYPSIRRRRSEPVSESES